MPEGHHPAAIQRASESELRWCRNFLVLLLGTLALRAAYAAAFPLDLAPDESYYWDWGRQPAMGYYSKPPMIGWLMGVAGWLGRDSFVVLKLFPALLVAAGLTLVFLLGRDMFGARAGFWAATLLLATPANAALSTFFTIDPPLFLFSAASLWTAWRWWNAREGSARWAVALTVSLGLGYLTKQIHLLFPVLLGVFLLVAGQPPRPRAVWQFAAILAASLVFLLPPLLWNWHHDWITLRHTAEELERTAPPFSRRLRFLGEFLGGQAGLGGGVTWLVFVAAGALTVLHWKRTQARLRYLALFFLPGFAAFVVLACFQRVEQNWPMTFYTPACVLAAGWAFQSAPPRSEFLRRFLPAGVTLGAILAIALMLVPWVVPSTAWAGSRSDPTARLRGWKDLAMAVQELRRAVPRPDETFLLAPRDRYVASALAFYLPDRPRTYCWEDPGRVESQYGIWGLPMEKGGWDALVIEFNPQAPWVREIAASFATWEPRGEIVIRLGTSGARDRRYQVYLGRGFRPPAKAAGEEAPGGGAGAQD